MCMYDYTYCTYVQRALSRIVSKRRRNHEPLPPGPDSASLRATAARMMTIMSYTILYYDNIHYTILYYTLL